MKRNLWIRALCLALCLAVLLPCVSALGETTKVTGYLLRLRAKPSTEAKVLDAFRRGTVVTVLKKGDTWTKVRVSGQVGYMMSCYLACGKKKAAEESKQNTEKPAKSSQDTGITAYVMKGVRLNLREEASSDSDILGSYRGGTKVTILKKGKYWCYVEVNGRNGYMGTEYLTTDKE